MKRKTNRGLGGVKEKKGATDRIRRKKPEVVKGNEFIPVSVQPLWFIIAAVFFGG